MTTRVVTVVAAALAAALVVSACAPSVGGRAVAGDAPARPAGELKSSQLPATPVPAPRWPVWEDVTGQGLTRWDRGEPYQAAWGPIPAPGVSIFTASDGMCTLGPAIRRADGADSGFVTAGHCAPGPGIGDRLQYMNASPAQNLIPLAALTDAEDDDRGIDSAAIWSTMPGTATIAGTWPVAGVLTVEGVEALELGTPVCYAGARSAVRCGPLEYTNAAGRLVFGTPDSLEGDSGAPVFLVSDGAAVLAAVLEGGDEVSTQATYLDPALERLHAQAAVDPIAAARITGQPGYSTRTTAG